MNLMDYFDKAKGLGVLATADSSGRVNTAVYARPHVQDDHHVSFIMTERRTYAHLRSNPYASYLFKEDGHGSSGVRLVLKKTGEENNQDRIAQLIRRKYAPGGAGKLHLVHFHVEELQPLVSSGECPITG